MLRSLHLAADGLAGRARLGFAEDAFGCAAASAFTLNSVVGGASATWGAAEAAAVAIPPADILPREPSPALLASAERAEE